MWIVCVMLLHFFSSVPSLQIIHPYIMLSEHNLSQKIFLVGFYYYYLYLTAREHLYTLTVEFLACWLCCLSFSFALMTRIVGVFGRAPVSFFWRSRGSSKLALTPLFYTRKQLLKEPAVKLLMEPCKKNPLEGGYVVPLPS